MTLTWYPEPIPPRPPAPAPPPKPSQCADPYGHLLLWSSRETTWRLSPAQRAAEQANGCPWCAMPTGRVVSPSPLLPRRYA